MIGKHAKKKRAINYPNICRFMVARHFNYAMEDVYIVWFCYTLKNFKALVSTNRKDKKYFEVTFNELSGKMYIDEYRKTNKVVLRRPQ